jgi:hypothetical protein
VIFLLHYVLLFLWKLFLGCRWCHWLATYISNSCLPFSCSIIATQVSCFWPFLVSVLWFWVSYQWPHLVWHLDLGWEKLVAVVFHWTSKQRSEPGISLSSLILFCALNKSELRSWRCHTVPQNHQPIIIYPFIYRLYFSCFHAFYSSINTHCPQTCLLYHEQGRKVPRSKCKHVPTHIECCQKNRSIRASWRGCFCWCWSRFGSSSEI